MQRQTASSSISNEEKPQLNTLFDLCAYFQSQVEKHKAKTKPFNFGEVYGTLMSACQKHNFKLEDVRDTNNYSLLHVMVALQDLNAVRDLVDAPHAFQRIPRNVKHCSTNNLLHFCGLFAKCDNMYFSHDNSSLNAKMIAIASLISNPNEPDHLPLDVKNSKRHSDGGTHAHSAAIAGAKDLLEFFNNYSSENAFLIPRYDGKRPIDFAKEQKHEHIAQMGNTSSLRINLLSPLNFPVTPFPRMTSIPLQSNNNNQAVVRATIQPQTTAVNLKRKEVPTPVIVSKPNNNANVNMPNQSIAQNNNANFSVEKKQAIAKPVAQSQAPTQTRSWLSGFATQMGGGAQTTNNNATNTTISQINDLDDFEFQLPAAKPSSNFNTPIQQLTLSPTLGPITPNFFNFPLSPIPLRHYNNNNNNNDNNNNNNTNRRAP